MYEFNFYAEYLQFSILAHKFTNICKITYRIFSCVVCLPNHKTFHRCKYAASSQTLFSPLALSHRALTIIWFCKIWLHVIKYQTDLMMIRTPTTVNGWLTTKKYISFHSIVDYYSHTFKVFILYTQNRCWVELFKRYRSIHTYKHVSYKYIGWQYYTWIFFFFLKGVSRVSIYLHVALWFKIKFVFYIGRCYIL